MAKLSTSMRSMSTRSISWKAAAVVAANAKVQKVCKSERSAASHKESYASVHNSIQRADPLPKKAHSLRAPPPPIC